jgi:hypothetical protein
MRRGVIFLLLTVTLVACGRGTPAPTPTLVPTSPPTATAIEVPTSVPTATSAPTPLATSTPEPTSTPAPTSNPTATPTAVPPTPTGVPAASPVDLTKLHIGDNGDGYGFNVWGLSGSAAFRDRLNASVQSAGFGWVRQQAAWSAIEPQKGNFRTDTTAQLDQFVNGASAGGLRVMLSVAKSPDWVGANGGIPLRTQDFTDFMTFLTQRYKGKVQAYEIWNEQNYAVETGGRVNVAAYLPLLKAGYQTVRKVDPAAVVVFGGLTPTGVNDPSIALNDVEYLRQIYALNGGEVKQYYDVLGAHPGSNCNPPDNSWPDNPATNSCGTDPGGGRSYQRDDSFYFKRVLEVRKVMEDAGENSKKLWLTEFGWTTANQAKGYEYGKFNSPEQQAQYLVRAFEIGKSYPWMGVMFVWNLNFATVTQPSDEKYPWGVVNADWSPRPAYTALKNMPK